MAFSQPIPRPFSERGIFIYAPAAPGIFGISNSRSWIHVASASNIREALLKCLRLPDTRLSNCAPTGFVFEACAPEIQANRRHQLIAEYDPICERGHQLSGSEARR
jgi:hypothetical protein